MMVAAHVATGALAGALLGSSRAAVPAGLALHVVCDAIPHRDLRSRHFEIASGVAGVLALALRRGLRDPATLGALASSAPDLEHVVPRRAFGARKLFPSHRWPSLHRSGGLGTNVQLAASAVVLAAVLTRT